MRKIFLTIILISILTSCSRLKKTASTERYKEETQSTEQVNETITMERVVDTMVFIPETMDTTAMVIIPQREVIAINNEQMKVTLLIDSLTNMVTVKAKVKERKIPIKINEKKIEQRVIKTESETTVKHVQKDSAKKVTNPPRFGWWIIGVLGLLVLYMFGGRLWPFPFILRRRNRDST